MTAAAAIAHDAPARYVDRFEIASTCFALGLLDEAMHWLDKAMHCARATSATSAPNRTLIRCADAPTSLRW